eukprot:gene27597-34341_t
MPADMILIATSDEEGIGFVETSNIDGETNLKLKSSVRHERVSRESMSNLKDLHDIELIVKCELPNSAIHHFHGTIFANGREVGVDATSLLLRGSTLRNTKWALGCVFYEMLCGEQAFPVRERDDDKSFYGRICKGQYDTSAACWKKISPEAKDLLSKMLCLDPVERFSASECLLHPWVELTLKCTINHWQNVNEQWW